MSKKSAQFAFTLIELLVVISIVALLASVVFASINTARAKARDAQRVIDIKQIQVALELYYAKNSRYPDPQNDFPSHLNSLYNEDVSDYNGGGMPGAVFMPELVAKGYLPHNIVDPVNKRVLVNGSPTSYVYAYDRLPINLIGFQPSPECLASSDIGYVIYLIFELSRPANLVDFCDMTYISKSRGWIVGAFENKNSP